MTTGNPLRNRRYDEALTALSDLDARLKAAGWKVSTHVVRPVEPWTDDTPRPYEGGKAVWL